MTDKTEENKSDKMIKAWRDMLNPPERVIMCVQHMSTMSAEEISEYTTIYECGYYDCKNQIVISTKETMNEALSVCQRSNQNYYKRERYTPIWNDGDKFPTYPFGKNKDKK